MSGDIDKERAMVKLEILKGRSHVTHRARAVVAEYVRSVTRAEKRRAAGLPQPDSVPGLGNNDTGFASIADRSLVEDLNVSLAGAEYAGSATDADKLRAAGLHQPESVAGLINKDPGLATMAERIRADGLSTSRAVVARYVGPATDADKLRAAGLHQPKSVAGLINKDPGLATMAERIRADGIK